MFGMQQQIEELLDPNRFIYLHHFLTEFQHKFETTYEDRIQQLKIIMSTLDVLLKNEDVNKELNDEIGSQQAFFPKSIILILRRLQERLDITPDELKYRAKKAESAIKDIGSSSILIKKVMSNYVQTEPLKEFDVSSKVINEK